MDHYNSTHAVLEEKKCGFEIALLQVRNVKQSSYFRWQWEPELFLANPTQLTSNEGKRNLCSQVFVGSCIRQLTACVLQRAALQSPVFTTECKFWRFALNILSWCSLCSATDDSMGSHFSISFQRASQAHKTTALLKHHKAETVELKWDGITNMYYIPQSYEGCGLKHFAPSPNNSPQKRAKSHCLNKLIPLFRFIYCKQSFFALRFMRVLKRERLWKLFHLCSISVNTLKWSILLAGFRRQSLGSQATSNNTTKSSFSQKEHLWNSSQAPQNLCCRICPPLTCILSEIQEPVRQICYHSNAFWLFTRLQHLAQVTGSWEELLRKVYISPVQKMQILHENYLMTAKF